MKKTNEGLRSALGTPVGMVLLAFLLPALCFGGGEARAEDESGNGTDEDAPAVLAPMQPGKEEICADGAVTVRVLGEDGTVKEWKLDEYLWGVVAAEMPAAFEPEALKAQAVAARTYTVWKTEHGEAHPEADVCTNCACCQAWKSREEMELRWGEEAGEYGEKIAAAVADTDGAVLYWEGEVIQAVYHSSSHGRTEDAVAVWGTEIPYLMGVDTPEGTEVPNYETTVTLTAQEVREALSGLGCDLSGKPESWFQGFLYTESGSVASVRVGGVTVGGTALRAALGLRSADFDVSYGEDGFRFSVTGYGHGVGMSQYGANALAKEGKEWEDIVGWYYTGVTVGSLP